MKSPSRSSKFASPKKTHKEENKQMIDDLNMKLNQITNSYNILSASINKESSEREGELYELKTNITQYEEEIERLSQEVTRLNKEKIVKVDQILKLTTGPEENRLMEKIKICYEETKRRTEEEYEEKIKDQVAKTTKLKEDINDFMMRREQEMATKEKELESVNREYEEYKSDCGIEGGWGSGGGGGN